MIYIIYIDREDRHQNHLHFRGDILMVIKDWQLFYDPSFNRDFTAQIIIIIIIIKKKLWCVWANLRIMSTEGELNGLLHRQSLPPPEDLKVNNKHRKRQYVPPVDVTQFKLGLLFPALHYYALILLFWQKAVEDPTWAKSFPVPRGRGATLGGAEMLK